MKFDKEAIEQAKRELGIELPVSIRWASYRNDGNSGIHTCTKDKHFITLFRPHATNKTLWHELAHCAQAEQFARETGEPVTSFNRLYKRSAGSLGAEYLHNEFELEAREVANRNSHRSLVSD